MIAEFPLEYLLQTSLLIGKAPAEFHDVRNDPFSQLCSVQASKKLAPLMRRRLS